MRKLLFVIAFATALAGTAVAGMDEWPTKPIKVILPTGPGSGSDVISRVVFEEVSVQLGKPMAIENRPGAGGVVGTAAVARAEPDGYTILATSSSHTIVPWLFSNQSFDIVNDFSGVIALGSLPTVLVTSPTKGRKTIDEFVAAARARPGLFNYTSAGVGTATHLSAERFRVSAGIEAVHIPTRSGPEALTEIMSGRADFYFCPLGTALPFIRDGKLLALVVGAAQRSPLLPDVPTTSEAGFPDADYTFWVGVFAPVKTPYSITDKLHRAIARALGTTRVQDHLAELGVTPMPMTRREFDSMISSEVAANASLVQSAGLLSH
jgi:tripartite-type tricarboxylate transporter receptor subunit TctC